jgi:hypothetical protein
MQLPPELLEVNRRVRVLRDRVLIRPIPYEHPLLATVGVDVSKGVVIGVGYGRRARRKTPFHQKMQDRGDQRTMYFEDGEETGKIAPMRVQVGDVVEFSFRNFTVVDFDIIYDRKRGKAKRAFPEVGDLIFVWQSAIMTIDRDESASASLLWQESAGYDRKGHFMSGAEAWTRA